MAKAKRPQIEPARFTGQLSGINTLLNAIREQIQIDQGDRGDPLDRAVKIRDLTDAGVAEFLLSKRGKGQYATVVAPSGNQLVTAAPPNPKNLQANPTTANVYLTWNAPNYPYHAYTEVWRSTENNLSTAVDLGARPAYRYYTDAVDPGRTFYYWIRFVTHAGKKSDYNAVDGVSATTNLDPSVVLETLNDKITSSQLVQGLRDEIVKIPTIENAIQSEIADRVLAVSNEVQNRSEAIAQEKQQRIEAIGQEAEQRANSILTESQDRIKSFQALQSIESLVGNDARELKALARISNEEVARIQQYQELTAYYQTLRSTSSAQVNRLDEAIANESSARASSITALTAKFESDLGVARDSAVEEAINVIATDESVIAEVLNKISAADTTGWATTTYVNNNAVTPLNALSSRTSTLESQYQSIDSTYLSQSNFADWQQTYTADQTATAERLDSLESSVTDPTTGLSSKASVSQLTQAKNDIYNSSVSQFGSIDAKFRSQQSDINARATQTEVNDIAAGIDDASIKRLSQAVATLKQASFDAQAQQLKSIDQSVNADRAQISRLDRIESEYKTGLSSASASITQAQRTFADELSSLAEVVEQYEAAYETDKATTLATKTDVNEIAAWLDGASVKRLSHVITVLKQSNFEAQTQNIKNIEQSSKADRSQITRYERLESEYKSGLSATKASITELSELVSTETTARATAITQIETTINNQTATIEQQAKSIDGLRANWTVKFQIDDNGVRRVSGFGLIADGQSTGAHFDVDQFSISKPGADALDFSVADVPQPDGTTKRMVVMDAASLVNLVVTNAMIENISADKITAGKINSLRIDTDTLTVRKVRSSNYIPNQTGVRLDDDGSFELNSSTSDGRVQQDGDGIKVFDRNGTLRVKIGRL
ncbi:hypothetical protein EBI00_02530 [Marinomonas hwangdonensis]|uniref:Tip attachment protein J central straight fiber domain-containing protein n=1 Tax=Marinomonas hwangdonensis TaxID=1053647 RepID=A0A3M8QAA1_9GAMM|nr:hypothetical protein [Marinomonas hwangdonensis]RNF52996.1 hypothetical protein EBI00_02530 [Marinomonas hwangdonensis]